MPKIILSLATYRLWYISGTCPENAPFLRYSTCKYTATLKPGLGSLKVIENDTIQSDTHDFLLTFHSNHRPISHRFRDKRRLPSKIANFSRPCVFNAPAEGLLLELGIGAGVKRN